MPVAKRIARSALLVLIVAALLMGAGGAYFDLQPGPWAWRGELTADGLEESVEVIRDRWGVPHIYARNEHDLFFAQGYVQAQDRLWQMEECRRMAQGTLAEVLGPEALASDRLARTLGFGRAARAGWQGLEEETRARLEAYAQGVNAYLSAPGRRLPIEFALLGLEPTPWQPEDTLAWAGLHAWSQQSGWQAEVTRARLVSAVGPERAAALDPAIGEAPLADSQLVGLAAFQEPLLLEGVDQPWPWAAGASGGLAWAVDGSRTASGGPILAAAPRTPVQMPTLWYEMHLVGGGYDVAGATLPGMPGVVIGRNRALAWALAGSPVDGSDLYVERMQVGDTPRAEYEGQWESVRVLEEEVRVRGESEPVQLRVLTTRHGVIVSDAESGSELQAALHWLGADQPAALLRCLPALNRAASWDEFLLALEGWGAPAQLLLYADTHGQVGYALAGTEARRTGQGALPLPGWTGEHEPQGAVQGDALPHGLWPGAEPLIAVDGWVAAEGWPAAGGDGTPEVFAAERIAELVRGADGLSAVDAGRILVDDVGPEQPLLETLLAREPVGWVQERTVPYLQEWDGRYDRESAGAGVYEAFYWRLAHNALDDELGPELVDAYLNANPGHRWAMEAVAAEADCPWFDDRRTPERDDREEIVARSLAEGLDGLGRRFGDLPYEWNWGRVHSVTFRHVLGTQWPLTILMNRGAMRAGGGQYCVDAAWPDYEQRMAVGSAPTYRMVVDLAAEGEMLAVNAPGQSGHPFSRHYADMVELWREGRYHHLLLEREQIEAEARDNLTLQPAAQL